MPEGIVEIARQLVVTLPATPEPGSRRAKVVLGAGDAPEKTLDVEWFVAPSLTVAPSGLVIERGNTSEIRSVVVRSDDRPFRVTRVSGFHLIGQYPPGAEAKTLHRINLQFDTTRDTAREAFDVRIETDHPDQPVVQIGVLMLKDEGKDTR